MIKTVPAAAGEKFKAGDAVTMGSDGLARKVVPFNDRHVKKIDDYAFTVACQACGEIFLYPEDVVAIDGKLYCGNCAPMRGVTI